MEQNLPGTQCDFNKVKKLFLPIRAELLFIAGAHYL